MVIGTLGAPYRVKRSYIYQFPRHDAESPKQKDVIFEDEWFGYYTIKEQLIELVVPAMFTSTRRRSRFAAYERIRLTNLLDGEDVEMTVDWLDNNKKIKRSMVFKRGEEVTTGIPMIIGDPNSPMIPAGYRVRDVHYELNESEFYAIVEFENYVPVYNKETQQTEHELFNLSCYEVHGQQLMFS